MKKRIIVCGAALAAFLLAGCSSSGTPEAQTETLTETETEATVETAAEAATAETAAETPEGGSGEVPAAVLDIATTQSFTEEAVSAEDAEKILLAGLNAPSAMNGQPWHFTAVTDNVVLRQIADDMSAGMPGRPPAGNGADAGTPGGPPAGNGTDAGTPGGPPAGDGADAPMPAPPAGGSVKAGIADAPLVIVISCREGSELDAGLACQNMSVAAVLMGYGTKIVTSPTIALNGAKREQYRELLDIPEGYSVAAVLLVGRAADSGDASTSATVRNSMDEVVSWIR